MIPCIKSIQPLDNFVLLVEFDGGEKVLYDVKDDIRTLVDFRVLETEYGLFKNAAGQHANLCLLDRTGRSALRYVERVRPARQLISLSDIFSTIIGTSLGVQDCSRLKSLPQTCTSFFTPNPQG